MAVGMTGMGLVAGMAAPPGAPPAASPDAEEQRPLRAANAEGSAAAAAEGEIACGIASAPTAAPVGCGSDWSWRHALESHVENPKTLVGALQSHTCISQS